MALTRARGLGCRDLARVDFKLDASSCPAFLEINPLPGLNRHYSDLCLEAAADGWSYIELVNGILDEAIDRYGLET